MRRALLLVVLVTLAIALFLKSPETWINAWQRVINGADNHEVSAETDRHAIPVENTTPAPQIEQQEPQQTISSASSSLSFSKQVAPIKKQAPVKKQGKIYRWVDEQGKVHYGDQTPDSLTEVEDQSTQFAFSRRFHVEIVGVDHKLPVNTREKVDVAVSKIFEVYEDNLQLGLKGDPFIKVKIFKSQTAFQDYRQLLAPKLETNTGFYVSRLNEATVWQNRSFDAMLNVITHECSHAILNYEIGFTPTWLNEGLAEYFESMNIFGQAIVVPPHPQWDPMLQELANQKKLPTLDSYFKLQGPSWYDFNKNSHLSYSIGWSLVFYLMSTQEGQQVISSIIKSTREDQYGSLDNHNLINEHYYGGIERLEKNWSVWLRSNKSAHRY